MPLALALDDLAARLAGTTAAALRDGPAEARAYALREAVAVARPDVLLVGWGTAEQTAALADAAAGADVVDALYDASPLDEAPALAALLETARVLTGIFGALGPAVALVLRGPCSAAVALGQEADGEAADVIGDALAALVPVAATTGAARIVLVEDLADADPPVHGPVARALDHQGVASTVLELAVGTGRVASAGGAVTVIDPVVLEGDGVADAVARLRAMATDGTLVVVAGQVPAGVALEALTGR